MDNNNQNIPMVQQQQQRTSTNSQINYHRHSTPNLNHQQILSPTTSNLSNVQDENPNNILKRKAQHLVSSPIPISSSSNNPNNRSKDSLFKVPQERCHPNNQSSSSAPSTSSTKTKEAALSSNQMINQQLDIMKSLEFKRDIAYLNNQLKDQHEQLKKISFDFSIMQTRLKKHLNSSTLSEIKIVHQQQQSMMSQQQNKDENIN